MAADRPAKQRVRELWVEKVAEAAPHFGAAGGPLYLTMCGAHGREIDLLIERGIITTSEVASVAEVDLHKVVAVEASPEAELALRRRFPALKVLRQSIQGVLRSGHPWAWPQGDDERSCRAQVVNLDLNMPFKAVLNAGQLSFPVVDWIKRLAEVHAREPVLDWTLCLTLHGEIVCDDGIGVGIQQYLVENFGKEPTFAQRARALLGDALYDALGADEPIDWTNRPSTDHQHLLMALVPKKIAQMVHAGGWFVHTAKNYHYGGTEEHAPMVTWIIDFRWDTRASTTPEIVYRESLQRILESTGHIEEDGTIS